MVSQLGKCVNDNTEDDVEEDDYDYQEETHVEYYAHYVARPIVRLVGLGGEELANSSAHP